MGTWGAAVFSDDTARDVRNDFLERVADGETVEEATRRLMKEHGVSFRSKDPDNATFWISLAAAQWQCGRVVDRVKEKALQVIQDGGDLEAWKIEGRNLAKRRAVLRSLSK